jgi:predicted ArsR family transcriptional regulator
MAEETNGADTPQKKKRGRPPKVRQTELPGVEGPGVAPKRIKMLERLADDYAEKRDDRIAASALETAAKKKLAEAVHQHEAEIGKDPEGVIRYEYDGGTKSRRVILLKPAGEELKVKDVEAFEEVNVG